MPYTATLYLFQPWCCCRSLPGCLPSHQTVVPSSLWSAVPPQVHRTPAQIKHIQFSHNTPRSVSGASSMRWPEITILFRLCTKQVTHENNRLPASHTSTSTTYANCPHVTFKWRLTDTRRTHCNNPSSITQLWANLATHTWLFMSQKQSKENIGYCKGLWKCDIWQRLTRTSQNNLRLFT